MTSARQLQFGYQINQNTPSIQVMKNSLQQ